MHGMDERSIYYKIFENIERAYPHDKNLIVNGTWLNVEFQEMCEVVLNTWKPTRVFIGSIVDPWCMTEWAEQKFAGIPITYFGNVDRPNTRFEFFAFRVADHNPDILETNLELKFEPGLFLCYQHKPSQHRDLLTKSIIDNNLLSKGFLKYKGKRVLGNGIVSDENVESSAMIYSKNANLGDMNVWNSYFVNVVSETVWNIEYDSFISEKTWKPIIGLRP